MLSTGVSSAHIPIKRIHTIIPFSIVDKGTVIFQAIEQTGVKAGRGPKVHWLGSRSRRWILDPTRRKATDLVGCWWPISRRLKRTNIHFTREGRHIIRAPESHCYIHQLSFRVMPKGIIVGTATSMLG
jgi:hypothetical protein